MSTRCLGLKKPGLKARNTHEKSCLPSQAFTPEKGNLGERSLIVRRLSRGSFALFPIKVGCFTIIHAGSESFKVEGLRREMGEFPDDPVLRTVQVQCRGSGFDPWSGN